MAKDVVENAKSIGIRAELDDSNESVAKKIAEAEKMKVPYTIVIGEKEVQSSQVEPRTRADLPPAKPASIEDFLGQVADHAKTRR
ncbi:hypothetical protein A3B63_01685 [Candidatus Saccharibacteria bacterium RIFCSPLOWO2_01_FULL_49_22]|nr:MAG: hypothetical protein A3B63_01685 [Candidatus Saccharibacteria bacterium RIFCSPLOWO2_01_FULL_49_22]